MTIKQFSKSFLAAFTGAAFLVGCGEKEPAAHPKDSDSQAFVSQYKANKYHPVLIKNATLLTATGEQIENGSVLLADG